MEVTETGSNNLGQISVNVNIEGETTPESTTEEEDSLLPGPSFISIISLLGLIVYRRKK
jgi:hypothetical protein